MGGLAGRADALFGAVESQKSTGSLHYHFFVFIQRLHQFASMKEIAELLEAKMVHATDLKDFLANICCESYSDLGQHLADLTPLESNFPTYSERTECDSPEKPLWEMRSSAGCQPFYMQTSGRTLCKSLPTRVPTSGLRTLYIQSMLC